jgi:hypothetical protein
MSLIPNARPWRTKDGRKVVAVDIVQSDGDAIKVDIGTRGVPKFEFNEIASVPVSIETLIVGFTVPVGKKFDISHATASGDNIGKYFLKVNDEIVQVKRSWWNNFNVDFNLNEIILNAGDKVEIFVENNGKDTVSFNGTIFGGEYDE